MRNNITSKNVLLSPWLAAFLDFPLLPEQRVPHTLWCWFLSPCICSFSLYPFWGTVACPQGCCRTGQHVLALVLTPAPSPLPVFTGPIPSPVGQGGEWVRQACSECVWWEPVCEACVRVPAMTGCWQKAVTSPTDPCQAVSAWVQGRNTSQNGSGCTSLPLFWDRACFSP